MSEIYKFWYECTVDVDRWSNQLPTSMTLKINLRNIGASIKSIDEGEEHKTPFSSNTTYELAAAENVSR